MGDPAPYAAAPQRRSSGSRRTGRPRPTSADARRGDPRRVPDAARRRADERAAPAPVRLLHAAAAADLDDGRAARPDDQPGRRRLARRAGRAFVEEEVVRWLCDLVGYGPALVRAADLGRRHGQLHGHDPRPRHPPRSGPGRRPAAARRACSRASGSTPRDQTPLLDRARARPARLPAETLVVVPSDDAVPPPRRAGRRGHRPRPCRRARRRSRSPAVAGSTNTGSVDAIGELADVAAAEDLWLHVDAAYGGAARLSARDAGRVPDLDRADSVTVDPHKWFFQAYDIGGLLVRDGSHLAATFGGRSPEYYRGGETPGGRARQRPSTTTTTTRDQLNFYKLSFEGTRRWRALKLWMSWKHLGTDGFGRLIEANDDLAAHLARRCAEADDFEALPEVPGPVGRLLPAPAGRSRRRARPAARRARRAPGPAPARARGLGRRLADDDAPARRDLAARRDRQLPLDRGRHRPPARDPSPPGRRSRLTASRQDGTPRGRGDGRVSRTRRGAERPPRSRVDGCPRRRPGRAWSAGSRPSLRGCSPAPVPWPRGDRRHRPG